MLAIGCGWRKDMGPRVLFVALLAVAVAGVASAPAARAQTRVTFERAALSDPAKAQAIYREIVHAAERECRIKNDRLGALSPSLRRRAVDACVSATVEATLAAAKAPQLVAQRASASR
jgi:UrcA family protein